MKSAMMDQATTTTMAITAMQVVQARLLTAVTEFVSLTKHATMERRRLIAQTLEITTKEQQAVTRHVLLGMSPIAQRRVVEVARTTCLMQTIYKRQWQCTSFAL